MKKIRTNAGKIWFCLLLMTLLISPSIIVKAESNTQPPESIESFNVDTTKEECSFIYNSGEAKDWMAHITEIKSGGQTIPVAKYVISAADGTITLKIIPEENSKISILAEGYQDETFIVQGEHVFNTAWKHDENAHWKECMIKGCDERTDEAKHSGGEATCQKKAECEVCKQEYGELGAHNYGSEWKHNETSHWRECQTEGCNARTDEAKHSGGQATYQKKAVCSKCKASYGEVKKEDKATKVASQIKKLDVKISNLTMKKISDVQAARKAYNTLSKKDKNTVKKEADLLIKAENLIKQSSCGTNVYYRFSNNTLTIFGKGAMKNCFTGKFTRNNIKGKIKNRVYQKYISQVKTVIVEQGVAKIGNGNFACMPKLKKAQIRGGLGIAAFWGCSNLEKVTYTDGKGAMGFACFAECKKLKNMTIAEGVSAINKSCFANCKKLRKVEFPTTLKTIGEICFFGCSNVTVTIKGRIKKCETYAFYNIKKCKIILKTKVAKKGKKIIAKALKNGRNKTAKIK